MRFLPARRMKEKGAVDRVHMSQIVASTNGRVGINDAYPEASQTGEITPKMAAVIYSQSPIAFAAVRVVANLLSNIPFNVYMLERNSSGKKTVKRTGYPYVMLQWVNPHMSLGQLMENTASWLKLNGNAYWAIEETAPQYSDISIFSIYPLNPCYVKIVPDKETGTKGYIYDLGTDKQWYPDNRVIHFKNFSPFDHWHGHSELNPLSYDLQVERYSKRQLRNWFSGGTVIDGVIEIEDDLSDAEVRKLKREFKEQHEGTKNAHRILVLTKGMKFQVPQMPSPSQAVAELLQKNLENNAMVFGVPVGVLLGQGEGLEEAKALMWEQTIQPLSKIIEDTVTKRLCLPVSQRLVTAFDFSNVTALRLKDLDRARVEVAHANTGIRTIDEIRADRNLDALNSEFSSTPIPEWQAAQKEKLQQQAAESAQSLQDARQSAGTGSSPSLPLTGSEGGRDQSSTGEAQMVDDTGQKAVTDLFNV